MLIGFFIFSSRTFEQNKLQLKIEPIYPPFVTPNKRNNPYRSNAPNKREANHSKQRRFSHDQYSTGDIFYFNYSNRC